MVLHGIVHNGVVVVDTHEPLPEGAKVQVIVETPQEPAPTLQERLLKLAGTVDDLPDDMARNHDHYIHGAPRK